MSGLYRELPRHHYQEILMNLRLFPRFRSTVGVLYGQAKAKQPLKAVRLGRSYNFNQTEIRFMDLLLAAIMFGAVLVIFSKEVLNG